MIQKFVKESYVQGTLKQYASHVKNYSDNYCRTLGLRAFPIEMKTLEGFMAWLISTNRPGSLKGAWTALLHHHQNLGYAPVAKNITIKALERKAEKYMAERGDKPRDAFLASMAKDFCLQMKHNNRNDVRDAAIITTGMRGMLRSSELAGLRFKHIVREGETVALDLGRRKSMQRNTPVIYLDSTHNITCPPTRLRAWLKIRRSEGNCGPEDLVFTTDKGKPLYNALLSDVVRRAAAIASADTLRISSHSLRIGGATEALIGGMTREQIMVMGSWKSDAFMLYLRGVEPASKGASRLMGL